jgi:hypothetical protein
MLPNYMITDSANLLTIFGKPGKGIHKHYCGVAIADVAMTGVAAFVILHLTNKSFPLIFAMLIVLGIGIHAAFGSYRVKQKNRACAGYK